MQTIKSRYQKRIDENKSEINRLNKLIFSVSLLRVAFFILAVFFIAHFWNMQSALAISLIITLSIFIGLIRFHNKLFKNKTHCDKLVLINQQELDVLNGKLKNLPTGEEYIDSKHYYTLDLDVFGQTSLFQLINRTCTKIGTEKLVQWLNHHLTNKKEIERRQESVKELATKLDFRQEFQRIGISNNKQLSNQELNTWITKGIVKKKSALTYLSPLVAILNITAISLVIANILPPSIWIILFVGFLVLNTILLKHLKTNIQESSKGLLTLATYAELFKLIENEQITDESLNKILEKSFVNKKSPSAQLKKLMKLTENIEQKNNILIALFLNGLFLWEFRLTLNIELWKSNHKEMLFQWNETLSHFDAINSLANFAYNNPSYTYPTIEESQFILRGDSIGHPLMLNKNCVTNPISMEKRGHFNIITGANMAGKSTYLRAIGVNYLLASIGTVVFAHQFTLTPNQLITSLRTSDSLVENESYFFAELKRLKLIINLIDSGKNLFIILDEILKGTNSTDKLIGSLELIKQFIKKRTNGLIATHDLGLTELQKEFTSEVHNYCFESTIEEGELLFEYKLKEGIVKNMNAYFLMKKMGIIE